MDKSGNQSKEILMPCVVTFGQRNSDISPIALGDKKK
jgi:hypothetical protein